jgi:hypothetical protein
MLEMERNRIKNTIPVDHLDFFKGKRHLESFLFMQDVNVLCNIFKEYALITNLSLLLPCWI